MIQTITLILGIVTLLLVGLSFVLKPKSSLTTHDIIRALEKESQMQATLFKEVNNMLVATMRSYNESVLNMLKSAGEGDAERLHNMDIRFRNLAETVDKQLTEMRTTVDEKLNKNLTARLNESFTVISERLEALYKGFGEINALSSGVSDLKRMLGNVKVRGTFGEIQLSAILEQMLAHNQFITNAQVVPGSSERVDFAIIMPGKDERDLLLPIDAKFPLEDYMRLVDASEKNDGPSVTSAVKAIEKRILLEAKKINEKYIHPPHSTDFAILYLPLEGLFAEVLKISGLVESLQRDYKIIICGPTTVTALLSSLQMGFKTLYIEKRSSEIWQALAGFKHEFENFIDLLAKTQKKLSEASTTIDDAARKTQKIKKQLNRVEGIAPNYFVDAKKDEEED